MRALRIIVACCLLVLAQPVLAAGPDDEQAIRDLQRLWDEAWNSHDIAALGSLVSEDVRFVNIAGVLLSGRNEFEKLQTRTHARQFKESVRTVSGAEIKFIAPDIAVAHVKWGMRGDKGSDGMPREPRNGVMMQVVMKRDGEWTVVAAQNTDIRWPPGTQNRTR